MGEDVSVSLVGSLGIHFGYYHDLSVDDLHRNGCLSDVRNYELVPGLTAVRVLYMTGATIAVTQVHFIRVPIPAQAYLQSHPTWRTMDENCALISLFLPSCNRNNDSKEPTIGE